MDIGSVVYGAKVFMTALNGFVAAVLVTGTMNGGVKRDVRRLSLIFAGLLMADVALIWA